MHLLATIPGTIPDGSAAVDLAQTPGDIVLLSSADTELALLAATQARLRMQDPVVPRLRLASILRLGHNFSVDLYMETVAAARLVVARLLGGSAYWPYGVERLVETCRTHRIPLALLPGDDKPDAELSGVSTLASDAVHRLWRYLVEGGPENAWNLLRYAGSLIGHEAEWAEPATLLRAGCYWPDRALLSLEEIAAEWRGDDGIVPIIFYRALVQSGNTAPVDALVRALLARRLRPLPIFVQSLKDGEAAALLGTAFATAPPAVILNATGFSARAAAASDPLAAADRPILQLVFAGSDEDSWRSGTRGLGQRDLAMNVALTEIDGRILSRAVSFKAPLGRDPETEADLVGYRPVADRIAFVADLARNWARLQGKPPGERRVALILANYPNRDGRIGNGVGLDTPASTFAVLQALAGAG
jgi:cobaltochelatase CobN